MSGNVHGIKLPDILPCTFQLTLTVQNNSINVDSWEIENSDDFDIMVDEVMNYLKHAMVAGLSYGSWSFSLVRSDNLAVLESYTQLEKATNDALGVNPPTSRTSRNLISRRIEEHRHIITDSTGGADRRR